MNFWLTLKKPISILAPMEDVTDSAFRQMLLRCGRPDVFFTEFVNADGLCSVGRDAVIHRLRYNPAEKPLVAQIWGTNPDNFVKAAALVEELGFDGLDINLGCPVPKVVKNGAGAALIDNPSLVKELFLAAKEGAPNLPISVKTRIGFKKKNTAPWVEFLLGLSPAVITLHGRTGKEMYRMSADWDEIALAVKIRNELKSSTLIIGNGDIQDMQDLKARSAKAGTDGGMIGRAVMRDLTVFCDEKKEFSTEERFKLLLNHLALFDETWGDSRDFSIMKKYFKLYISAFPAAPILRARLMEARSTADVKKALDDFMEYER